jgi:hypothetical protein
MKWKGRRVFVPRDVRDPDCSPQLDRDPSAELVRVQNVALSGPVVVLVIAQSPQISRARQ